MFSVDDFFYRTVLSGSSTAYRDLLNNLYIFIVSSLKDVISFIIQCISKHLFCDYTLTCWRLRNRFQLPTTYEIKSKQGYYNYSLRMFKIFSFKKDQTKWCKLFFFVVISTITKHILLVFNQVTQFEKILMHCLIISTEVVFKLRRKIQLCLFSWTRLKNNLF